MSRPPRWLLPTARVAVAVVGVTALVLSYGALHELALGARIDENLAWLWPVSVDVLAVVSAIAARVFHGGQWSAAYAWTVLTAFLGLSVWGNGLHAVADRAADETLALEPWQAVVVSATPPVALALALHLLLMMTARYEPDLSGTASELSGTAGTAVRDSPRPHSESVPPAPPQALPEPAETTFAEPPADLSGTASAPVPDSGDNPGDAPGDDDGDEVIENPDPLLPLARELSGTGPPLSRTALVAALRDAGERCGTDRAIRLMEALAAERSAAVPTPVPDSRSPVPDSLAGRNGATP